MKYCLFLLFSFSNLLLAAQNIKQPLIGYVAPDNSFQLSYSKEWIMQENLKGYSIYLTVNDSVNKLYPAAIIGLYSISIPAGNIATIQKIKEQNRSSISELKNSKIIEIRDKNLKNYLGFFTDYTFTDATSSNVQHHLSWLIEKDRKWYIVQYKSTTKMDKEYLEKAKAIMNSLSFAMEDNISKDSKVITSDNISKQISTVNEKWYLNLPPCPCNYDDAKNRGKTDYPKGEWKDCGSPPSFPKDYHFGAIYEVRWVPEEKNAAGQQCTYDDKKNLITGGLAAGTPDMVSPRLCDIPNLMNDHINYDVRPWEDTPCVKYLENWPPNIGEYPCNRKPNIVNSFTHLIDFVEGMPCQSIIDLFKQFRDGININSSVKKFMQTADVGNRNEATFLLQYFRGISKNVTSEKDKYIKNFSDRVAKSLEEYLLDNPEDVPVVKTTFKINPKDVTISTDKAFKWYDWTKAPEDFKTAAGYINTYKDETLLDEINQKLKEKCTIQIAAVDLDGDGICGLAIFSTGNSCCGTQGCSFDLYENGGIKIADLGTDHEVTPAKNGVIASTNKFFPIIHNPNKSFDADAQKKISTLFAYDRSQIKIPIQTISTKNLVGGSTPEELGKILLKALQTNNKQLWINCIHPESNDKEGFAYVFDKYRRELAEEGLNQWSLVKFSRVRFSTDNTWTGANEPEFSGEKVARDFKLEFTYKEYIGEIRCTGVLTYKKNKYFLYSSFPYRALLKRK